MREEVRERGGIVCHLQERGRNKEKEKAKGKRVEKLER